MSRLCLQSTAIRDRLRALLPDSRLAATATVWQDLRQVPATAAETELWVPPPFVRDTSLFEPAIAAMPQLAVIQTMSAGVDPVLPYVPDRVIL